MKTLLIGINAKYIHTNNALRLLKANTSYDVDLLEYTIKDNLSSIQQAIQEHNPDIVGFSCYIWNIEMIKRLLYLLKNDDITVVLGGPEVSYDSEYLLTDNLADFIIRNEGEIAFHHLLDSLHTDKAYKHIPNIQYKYDGKIISNTLNEITDLSTINPPYYFENDIPHIPHKIAYIESSRGCPYKCSYCLSSLEKNVRFFNLTSVQDAILYLMKHHAKTIKFLDRTFNASKHTLSLLDFIITHHNNETVFQFEITGDILDPDIIRYLNTHAKPGIFRFEIGIQSTNITTNQLVDRFQNNERLFNNIKLIQEGNIIDLHLDLIAGLPKEDITSFKETFDSVFHLGAKEIQLGFLKFLKGTKIRNEASKYNYRFETTAPYQIIESDVLSPDDLDTLEGIEHMLDLFHNKGYFRKQMLQYLLSLDSPFEFFKKAYEYSKTHNTLIRQYQLEDIYQLAFNIIKDPDIIFLLKQDYFNRSKIKPKIFWKETISSDDKSYALEQLSKDTDHSIADLYKHTVLTQYKDSIFITYYEQLSAYSYLLKKHTKST